VEGLERAQARGTDVEHAPGRKLLEAEREAEGPRIDRMAERARRLPDACLDAGRSDDPQRRPARRGIDRAQQEERDAAEVVRVEV